MPQISETVSQKLRAIQDISDVFNKWLSELPAQPVSSAKVLDAVPAVPAPSPEPSVPPEKITDWSKVKLRGAATAAQINYLSRLGVAIKPGLSKAEASSLISTAKARR